MDTNDERTFPWIPISYTTGRSDKNEISRKSEVSHSSEKNREGPECSELILSPNPYPVIISHASHKHLTTYITQCWGQDGILWHPCLYIP
jgi:hypothetical protein